MTNIPSINFKKVTDKGNTLFNQTEFYEGNFDKINQEIVVKINELDTQAVQLNTDLGDAEGRLDLAETDLDALELNKVDKVAGKGLSTNDYTALEKQKLNTDIPAQLAEKAYKFGDFLYFYDNYNEFKALTGGFSNGFDSHPLEEVITKTEKQFNCLKLLADMTNGVGGNLSEISFSTTEAIDLTDINTLYIDWENTGSTTSVNNQSYFIAGSIKDDNHNSFSSRLTLNQSFARRLSALDVSSLQGEYYIRVHSRNSAFVKSEVKIYRVFGGV